VTPLYDAGGVATHLIGIVHDITERKRLEESHREDEQRLIGPAPSIGSLVVGSPQVLVACGKTYPSSNRQVPQ
jgi:hypothetical protein